MNLITATKPLDDRNPVKRQQTRAKPGQATERAVAQLREYYLVVSVRPEKWIAAREVQVGQSSEDLTPVRNLFRK